MNKTVGSRIRPWTQGPMVRRRRDHGKMTIVLPTMDTYRQQMEQVQRLYERLHLTDSRRPRTFRAPGSADVTSLAMTRSYTFAAASDTSATLPPSSVRPYAELPNGREHETHDPKAVATLSTVEASEELGRRHAPRQQELGVQDNGYHDPTQTQTTNGRVPSLVPHPSRPLAYSYPLSSDRSESIRYVSRKYGWVNPTCDTKHETAAERKARVEDDDGASSSGVSSDEADDVKGKDRVQQQRADLHRDDPHGQGLRRRDSLDIMQLCEHLRTRGLGDPVLSIHSHTGRPASSLPPGVRARCLPRDPGTREKIKGRARLDYELANLRAAAFCEQQHPRAFRTASADLRDRDVRLLEEEERENVHRHLNATRGDPDRQNDDQEGEGEDDEEDDSSLVGSPLTREELFFRIEAWVDEVDKAFKRG